MSKELKPMTKFELRIIRDCLPIYGSLSEATHSEDVTRLLNEVERLREALEEALYDYREVSSNDYVIDRIMDALGVTKEERS